MVVLRAFLYLLAFLLVLIAGFGVTGAPKVSLALLGAAVFILAFALPDIVGAF